MEQGTALIHVEYGESYKNKQQDEIQSAYFGQSSFSIFTACVYFKPNASAELVKKPVTVISESSDHSRIASMTCVHMIIVEIEKFVQLKKIILWSDGCAAQFRSRFLFKILSQYRSDLDLEWHFNEAHHGKGPMDGIGGTIKNVKSGKVVVNSAKEFCDAANRLVPSITSLFQTDLLKEPEDINKAPKIPDTLKIHKWSREVVNGGCELKFFYLSNDKEPFKIQQYSDNRMLECGHEEKEYESLSLMRSICALCAGSYDHENEKEDWLKCSICLQWFHESCF